MSLSYAWEKSYDAVHHLATSEGDLRKRLISVFLNDIMHIRAEELPEDIRTEFEKLMADAASEEPVGQEGLIDATISRFSADEASRMAERVVNFYTSVVERRTLEKQDRH
jgi:hypothetical protein